MDSNPQTSPLPALPASVERALGEFAADATAALGSELRAIVLYGSAAEGQLRATSDVNLIVVLAAFDATKLDALREPLRVAHAAVGLSAMFLLESEIDTAIDAFAEKFADVLRRRRVLYGPDPFAGRAPSRGAEIARMRQVLLNLVLRMRHQYMLRSLRDEQSAVLVADMAGPLRSCAATLLELRGQPADTPKHALALLSAELPGGPWDEVLARVSEARETGALPPGTAAATLLALIELARLLHAHAQTLR